MGLLKVLANIRNAFVKSEQVVVTEFKDSTMQNAMTLQQYIVRGEIDPQVDFPGLVNEGLDPLVIECWKHLYSK